MGHTVDLSQIQPGLRTPVFKVKLDRETVRPFHEAVGWADREGIAPTLPVTFWQLAYPRWLSACTLPQILREQSVIYHEPLRFDQEYDCWIECTKLNYLETKSGKTFLSVTHRLSGNREGKRVWEADTILLIPSLVPEGAAAAKAELSIQAPNLPANQPPVWQAEITAQQIRQFADASGDRQAIHLDKEAAAAAGYPDVLAHGMYGVGLTLSHFIQTIAGCGRLQRIRVQFISPLFAGETLCCDCTYNERTYQLVGFTKEQGKRIFAAELQFAGRG